MNGDFISADITRDWLAVGWFTPNYEPFARAFAAGLAKHFVPFHLYAKPAQSVWSTRSKPIVALEAMDAYPGKTVVLMDVDCIVSGDIAQVADIAGDVGITILARNMRKRKMWQHWIAAEASSRVVILRPIEGARTFLRRWADVIESNGLNHDEHSMIWAFLTSPDVRFHYIPLTYSGREVGQVANPVIAHDSAHHKTHGRAWFKRLLRAMERPFRTGRTSAEKVQLRVGMFDNYPRLQRLLPIAAGVLMAAIILWNEC
jgi:hypothetical protein